MRQTYLSSVYKHRNFKNQMSVDTNIIANYHNFAYPLNYPTAQLDLVTK